MRLSCHHYTSCLTEALRAFVLQVNISGSLAPSSGPHPGLHSTVLTALAGLKGKLVLVPGAGCIYLAGGNPSNPHFPPATDRANI